MNDRCTNDEGAMWVPPSHQPTPMAPIEATRGWLKLYPRLSDEDVERVAEKVAEKLRRK